MKRSISEKTFSVFNYIVLSTFSLLTLYPFLYVLFASISIPANVEAGKAFLWPDAFLPYSYRKVFSDKMIWTGYKNTIIITVVGVLFSLFITTLGAYSLSKKRLAGRKVIMFFIVLTMWFNAGIIPIYLNIKSLGLRNSLVGLIVAFGVNSYYIILMRTYFQSISDEIEESAKIDGANDLLILFKIVLPLAKPAIATIGLYYAVQRWNDWFWASVLITDVGKIPLPVYLKQLLFEMQPDEGYSDMTKMSHSTFLYATLVVSIVPIIIVYPFIQKFFVKGIMLGSLKG